MKKLSIGIQTFSIIVSENFYYVDKTKLIPQLVENGAYYFLSRPRRFGKSLFLDTLREAFLGHKKYFQGLYLENHWDWSKSYPVIRIDFGSGVIKTKQELEQKISDILYFNRQTYELEEFHTQTQSSNFEELIRSLEKNIVHV